MKTSIIDVGVGNVSSLENAINYLGIDYNLVNYKKNFLINNDKDIDFLFYYRKYAAHDATNQIKIIKKLAQDKYNIYVVGDFLNLKNV